MSRNLWDKQVGFKVSARSALFSAALITQGDDNDRCQWFRCGYILLMQGDNYRRGAGDAVGQGRPPLWVRRVELVLISWMRSGSWV
jgi:hypothetical protein